MGTLVSKQSDPSKHINISNVPERTSSPNFCEKRRLHYRNEFNLAREPVNDLETIRSINPQDMSIPTSKRRPSFLEPPNPHNEVSRDLFHQRSIKSEVDEYTFAKSRIQHKKSRSHIEKHPEDESQKRKKVKNKQNPSRRRHSHQPGLNEQSDEVFFKNIQELNKS